MKNMLKALCLLLCLTLLPALAALPALAQEGDVVTVTFVRPGNKPVDYDAMIANVNNKLAEDGMKIALEITYVPSDVFQDKVAMMLSSGEPFDLLCVMEDQKAYSAYVSMEGLMPINQYLNEVGAELKKVIPEFLWESASIGGQIYTIPAYWTDLADQASCITLDKTNLAKYGVEVPQTMDDLMKLCDAYAANWDGEAKPYVIPMFKEPFTWLFRTFDSYPFSVVDELLYVNQNGEVSNWLTTDEFKACADFFNALYLKGYISPDILSPTWSSWKQFISGNFMWVDGCQMWGSEAFFQEQIPGSELDSIYLAPDATSFRPAAFRNSTAVSATAEHPKEAVAFLNWVYSEQDNYDALIYGVEGVNWEAADNKQMVKISPEAFNDDWMIGNLSFLRTEVGTFPTFTRIMHAPKEGATNSVVMNFTFDPANVATEYSNCLALVASDIYPIKLGIISYADGGENLLKQLEAAGIDKVVSEYQAQLNQYLGK